MRDLVAAAVAPLIAVFIGLVLLDASIKTIYSEPHPLFVDAKAAMYRAHTCLPPAPPLLPPNQAGQRRQGASA